MTKGGPKGRSGTCRHAGFVRDGRARRGRRVHSTQALSQPRQLTRLRKALSKEVVAATRNGPGSRIIHDFRTHDLGGRRPGEKDRKSTRLNSSHANTSYA